MLKIRENIAGDEKSEQHYISNCVYYYNQTNPQP
jgi:hypothetical protein